MRKVLKSGEIAHVWAHQQQEEGRVQTGNFYFEGRTIYSYGRHFPIAVIDENDSNIVYFTTDTYSNTTTGHIHAVRAAINHKTLIYCLDPVNASEGLHTKNLEDFNNRCKHIAKNNLRNARKPEIYLNQIAGQRRMFLEYCTHFKIKKSVQNRYKYIWIESQDGGLKATEKEIKAAAKRLKEDTKRRIQQHKIDVDGFRSFERAKIWTREDRDYLRYNTSTQRIETSQGIEIPVKIAQAFYKWVKSTVQSGGCKGECKMSILNFEVQYVNADEIKIGCHVITSDEYEHIATELGWNK